MNASMISREFFVSGGNGEDVSEQEYVIRFDLAKSTLTLYSILAGVLIFYFCISLYLFGDLAIYGTAVPKTIRNVIW